MTTYRLPLFPLQVVLLPGQRLPLHIFEERYKIMIGECIEDDAPFGIVLVGKGGIHKIGCAARITQVLEKFPDGRMNILTQGGQRFEVFRVYDSRPYFEGEVGDFMMRKTRIPRNYAEWCGTLLKKAVQRPGICPMNCWKTRSISLSRRRSAQAAASRKTGLPGVALSRMAPEATARVPRKGQTLGILHHRLREVRSQKRTLKPHRHEPKLGEAASALPPAPGRARWKAPFRYPGLSRRARR